MLFDIGAKRSADEWNVANDRHFIFCFLHVFTHQSTKDYGLPIINADARGHLAGAKHRLVNHIWRQLNRLGNRNTSHGIDTHCIDGAAVVDKALELHYLRNEIEIDSRRVSADYGFDFQCDAGIARLPILRGCRRDNDRHDRARNRSGSANRRNLRRCICSRVAQFSDDFDDGALPAFGRHAGRREKIDSLFLVERANHDLKLRVGENPG